MADAIIVYWDRYTRRKPTVYTNTILPLLVADPEVDAIADGRTGEIIWERTEIREEK